MKTKKETTSLNNSEKGVPFSITEAENSLSLELVSRFNLYPENTRRPVNKTIFRNDYFKLVFNMKTKELDIVSRGDIVYSTIPYDTARNYIQRAAIQYLLRPEQTREYIYMHKNNLERYIKLSIFQVTGNRVNNNSLLFKQAYNAILQNPLFEIQILGRLLQHDETGPVSANIAGKFLFSENVNTGISEYVYEYLKFIIQLTVLLPISTDGKIVKLLERNMAERTFSNSSKFLTYNSDISTGLNHMPNELRLSLEKTVKAEKHLLKLKDTPILKSELGKEIIQARNNYIPHSVHPKKSEKYFDNIHSTKNTNLLNVVSDVHTTDGKLPFSNKNFNILVGDISDSRLTNKEIKGLYVIGNHELVDVLPLNRSELHGNKWKKFLGNKWFKQLLKDPDSSWYMLPVGDHKFYEVVKVELEERFPQMNILHNSSFIHQGIRYIGLTVPVALVKRKKEQQKFILKTLNKLFNKDYDIPTIIVSHAPLFNELSMLSIKSKAYNKNYNCIEPKIEKLFKDFNVLGVIHGHHHIPASSGQSKTVKFGGKELFVVCSIYSKLNTGYELIELVNPMQLK